MMNRNFIFIFKSNRFESQRGDYVQDNGSAIKRKLFVRGFPLKVSLFIADPVPGWWVSGSVGRYSVCFAFQ